MNKYGVGGCIHEPWVKMPGKDSLFLREVESPVVLLANDGDGYYVTEYNSWEEVNDLIAQLKKCATEAFGEEPKS